MHFTIITLFPEMLRGPFESSIIGRSVKKEIISIEYVQIRDFASDKRGTVDERPYGGGDGMVLRVDVLDKAIQHAKSSQRSANPLTILLDPRGTPYTQQIAGRLSKIQHVILVCGHYEGIDERIRSLVDETISIGDYVLTGGEIPAMVIVDTVTRLLPGALGKNASSDTESFVIPWGKKGILLEYPQYTSPREYKGMMVPDVLVSGNHKEISKWRREMSLKLTRSHRPDLLVK